MPRRPPSRRRSPTASRLKGRLNVSWWSHNGPAWVDRQHRDDRALPGGQSGRQHRLSVLPVRRLHQQAAGWLQLRHRRRHAADVRHLGDANTPASACSTRCRRISPRAWRIASSKRRSAPTARTASTTACRRSTTSRTARMLVNPALARGGRGDGSAGDLAGVDRQRRQGHEVRRSGPHHAGRVPDGRQRRHHLPLPGDDPAAGRDVLGGRRRPRQFPDRRRQEGLAGRDRHRHQVPRRRRNLVSRTEPLCWSSSRARRAMCMGGPWAIAVGQQEFPDLDFGYVNLPTVRGHGEQVCRRVGLGRGRQRQRRGREQGGRLEVHRLHVPAGQSARLEHGHLHHPRR